MSTQYLWDRITGPDPALRAADADRERTAERLRTSHAEGRLDLTEFQDRLDHCYGARTLGELAELVRDLPRDEVRPARRAPSPWRLARFAPILVAFAIVAAATGHHVFGWLWIPVVFVIWRFVVFSPLRSAHRANAVRGRWWV